MPRFGAIVRFLMILLCAVPFTSVQQAGIALAPGVPFAPSGQAPTSAPTNEEDDERESAGSSRLCDPAKRPLVRERTDCLSAVHTSHLFLLPPRTTPPVAADPFRNGLGSPYRC